MRFFLVGLVVFFSQAALALEDCRSRTPTADQVATIEAKIEGRPLPLGKLDRYARYYAGVICGSDRTFVRGKLVPLGDNDMPGAHIVEGKMPPLQAEGCISGSEPDDGRLIYLTCARRGAWTPSATQIVELEGLLRDRGSMGLDYARHYAGVTEGEHSVIRGQFVKEETFFSKKSGIYIASEVELPMIADGGCGVINVRYDLSSKEIAWRCN